MPRSRKPDKTEALSADAKVLIEFWREVMSGHVKFPVRDGTQVDYTIPLEMRMRASENLAKYLMPKQSTTEESTVVTPEILKVAQLLEVKATQQEVEDLLKSVEDSGDLDG